MPEKMVQLDEPELGVDQIGSSWPRALGIVLLGAGAELSLAR